MDSKRFEAEAAAYRVLEALGPEGVERGLNAYTNYSMCCRSWQSCFLAQALNISEDVARHDPDKILKIAESLDVKPSDVKSFITTFDGDGRVPTRRLQEMCYEYLNKVRSAAGKLIEKLAPKPDMALERVLAGDEWVREYRRRNSLLENK